MPGLFSDPRQLAIVLLFGGGLGLLLSVMFATRAINFELDTTPTRRIFAHWLPIVAAVFLATILRQGEIAVAIIFGTSVAMLSVVTGFVAMAGPLIELPAHARRVWPFLPVLATLIFVLGLAGTLGRFEVIALTAQGLLLLLLWTGRSSSAQSAAEPSIPDAEIASTPRPKLGPLQFVAVLASMALAAVAAWAATRGAQILSQQDIRYPGAVIAATLLSIALALPMVSTGVNTAAEGRPALVLSAQVGILILNFTVLLPATILLRMFVEKIATRPTTSSATAAIIAPFLYPRLSWRIDAIALLILSLLMVPIAEGKIRLDRRLGGWLIFGYCVYLLTVLLIGGKAH
jgi:Ca2+/Na+ antiporter